MPPVPLERVERRSVYTNSSSLVLGTHAPEYVSQAMDDMGQREKHVHEAYVPRRTGAWKKLFFGENATQ